MKRDKASFFALLAAAVILGAVGIKSYFDYRLASETRQQAAVALPSEPVPAPQPTPAEEKAAEAAAIDQMPRAVLPPIPDAILNPVSSTAKAGSSTKSPTAPATKAAPSTDAEMLRQETALFQKKLDQLRSGARVGAATSDAPSGLPSATEAASQAAATPNSALQAALNPDVAILAPEPGAGGLLPPPRLTAGEPIPSSGGTPAPVAQDPVQSEADIAAMAEQIKRQPAIAQVTYYDTEAAILALNGGEDRNLKPEMRLAVRRGSEILGFIKVLEVQPKEALAELMSKNKHSPTARKPERGDDVIAFNLF